MYAAAFVLALAASALARTGRLKRQSDNCIVQTVNNPDANAVIASINQWNNDVDTVNSFLNTALTLSEADLNTQAKVALTSASDEPCQLATLSSLTDINTDAFNCAVSDLNNIFQVHVLNNLELIVEFSGATDQVKAAVDEINLFRCCNVLPDASILFTDASEDLGVGDSVQKVANREDACASINCDNANPKCASEDNGMF